MNKLNKYRKIASVLNVLARQDKDFKELQKNLLRQYDKIEQEMIDLLSEKILSAKDYDSIEYYKCYLEKLV